MKSGISCGGIPRKDSIHGCLQRSIPAGLRPSFMDCADSIPDRYRGDRRDAAAPSSTGVATYRLARKSLTTVRYERAFSRSLMPPRRSRPAAPAAAVSPVPGPAEPQYRMGGGKTSWIRFPYEKTAAKLRVFLEAVLAHATLFASVPGTSVTSRMGPAIRRTQASRWSSADSSSCATRRCSTRIRSSPDRGLDSRRPYPALWPGREEPTPDFGRVPTSLLCCGSAA